MLYFLLLCIYLTAGVTYYSADSYFTDKPFDCFVKYDVFLQITLSSEKGALSFLFKSSSISHGNPQSFSLNLVAEIFPP